MLDFPCINPGVVIPASSSIYYVMYYSLCQVAFQTHRMKRFMCAHLFTYYSEFIYSRLPNVTTKRKEPHACKIGWNIDSNKPHASPGLYSSNAFVVIKASPISSSKSHIVLNKPHASLFGHYIGMNKPSVRNKAIGCYISQSRVNKIDDSSSGRPI